MRAIVTGPKSIALPSSLGGNDTIFGLIVVCATRGLTLEEIGDRVRLEGITDKSLFTPQLVGLLVQSGCEVERYPMFFEVTDLNATIPGNIAGLSGKKWSELTFGGQFSWSLINGKYYRGLEMPPDGEPLRASQWLALQAAGVTLVGSMPETQDNKLWQ